MIKGVNRQIIEIHDTGSKLFDKALLFVNAEQQDRSEAELKTEAQRILRSYAIGEIPDIRPSKRRLKNPKSRQFIVASVFAFISVLVILMVFLCII